MAIQTFNQGTQIISSYWVNHCLAEGEYVFWNVNEECLELRQVHYLERLWRNLLAWTGLCDSTTKKCIELSRESIGVFWAQAPFQRLSFCKKFSKEDYWGIISTCCEIWQKASLNFLSISKALKYNIPFEVIHGIVEQAQKWEMSDFLRELNVFFEEPVEKPKLPSVQAHRVRHETISKKDLNHEYLIISEADLDLLPSILEGFKNRSCKPGAKVIQVSMSCLKWPHKAFSACEDLGIDLWPTGLTQIEISSLENYDKLIKCMKINPKIRRLYFHSSEIDLIPPKLASEISSLPNLEYTDMGKFMWPLRVEDLPKGFSKVSSRLHLPDKSPKLPSKLLPTQPTWNKLISEHFKLGPRVEFTDGQQASLSLPLGFVRRMSAKVHQHPNQLSWICQDSGEIERLRKLFQLGCDNDSILPNQLGPELPELLLTAYKWQMKSLIELLLKSNPSMTCRQDMLEQLPLAADPSDKCPDLTIAINNTTISIAIDRYQLLASKDHYKRVLDYSDQAYMDTICINKDPQITIEHLLQYYDVNPLEITEANCEGFWILAIVKNDDELLQKVLHFIKQQPLNGRSWSTLDRWYLLAISSKAHDLASSLEDCKLKMRSQIIVTKQSSKKV